MKLSLDKVEKEIARLWSEAEHTGGGARVQLATLVAMVSEPGLLERAQKVLDEVVRSQPARTIAAVWREGASPSITAEIALHRVDGSGPVCGDAITLEAIGAAREWLPGNADRLALPDLPVCVWWVGDLPDHDDLFDQMVVGADLVVVNSGEMDLRDLDKLASIATRSQGRYALADLTWIRLRTLQDWVARFFDDVEGHACLPCIERITIDFAPRADEKDATSTQAGLLFGWMATALGLPPEKAEWTRGPDWAEVKIGALTGRFHHRPRPEVRPGVITRVAIEAGAARFEIERQQEPRTYRWSRDVPGVATPAQILRVGAFEEPTLFARCIERPKRDAMLEKSLQASSHIVRPVAPQLAR